MEDYIADAAVRKMIEAGQAPKKSKVAILGLTFKENCPDIRNSKVYEIIRRFQIYGINSLVVDPWVSPKDAEKEYHIELSDIDDVYNMDCIIIAVAHDIFKNILLDDINRRYKKELNDKEKVLIDVKGIYNIKEVEKTGMSYWRL